VARFLQNANDGRYSQARALLTPEVQKYFDSEFSAVHGDLMSVLDGLTKDGQLSLIRYPLANVRGEGITVVADMQYRDGTSREYRFRVVQSGKDYRIALDLPGWLQSTSGKSVEVAPASAAVSTVGSSQTAQVKPTVLSSSEDILTGSGVVTRPESPTPNVVIPRMQTPQPTVQTDDSATTSHEVQMPATEGEPALKDRPWQPVPAPSPAAQ
jgi:hypothetical protein